MRLTLGEVTEATGGALAAGDPAALITSVSIDTRTLAPGALFVALSGERDGHDFVAEAFARGAAAALVRRQLPGTAPGLVVVPDPAAGLTALGRHARQRLSRIPVVAITGSTGKTSTKDLAAAALAARFDVCASEASFNNEIGVPLTLLSATEETGVVVAEMGARGIGHIAALAEVARPAVGVIINIGIAHTEFFGSRSEVARAKGELLESLPPDGHAVLSSDDDMTPGLAGRSPAPALRVGRDPSADVVVRVLSLDRDLRPSFDLETPWGPVQVRGLPLRGAHQATNAAFAVAVAGVLGVPPEEAVVGLSKAVGSRWRMELSRTASGLAVLNDAYNANPASMAAALEALAGLGDFRGTPPDPRDSRGTPPDPRGGRRFAVLGQMAELGPHAVEEHRRIGRLVAACGLETLVVVGHEAAPLVEAAREGGVETVVVDTAEDALAVLGPRLRPGDSVLVKASRVVGLERVALALETWP